MPTDSLVETGQQLTWRATPYIDPWAWYCGPGFPDSDEFVRPWRVARVRRRTSPLVPLPGSPGTSVADHSRAEVVDVPAVVHWPSGEDVDHAVDHLVTLEAYGDHPRVHSTSR